jgi:asparagine synthase (glutamine-hydrolysing)
MDRLIGRIGAVQSAPDAGADSRARGPGYAVAASGRADFRQRGHDWTALVGAPYRTDGAPVETTAPDPVDARSGERLAALGGEFVVATYDENARALVLATDLFASIPLYYAPTADGIAFGTDFAWVSRELGAAATIDPQAIYDYLFFTVVPGSRTIRRGVHRLPAASMLVFREGRASVTRYWSPDFRRGVQAAPGELRSLAFDALAKAVARRAGQPATGSFLSGGLDSSSVAGLAARHGASRAFTIGFDVPDYDESRYARISAGHFGLELNEKTITSAAVSDSIDAIVAACPEPYGNASAVPAYLCARFAREQGVARLLAGDGGDELFGGNERYQKQAVFNLYGSLPAWVRAGLVDPLAALTRRAPSPLAKLASYVDQARVPLPDRLFAYNLLVRSDPATVLDPGFLARVDRAAPLAYAGAVYREPASGDALDRMLYLDWALTLTDNDLPKVRIACALAGVEVHFPMLDPAVVQVSTQVPSREKLDLRVLRKFYKQAFSGFLPPEVIAKQKHGFGVPVGIWMNADRSLAERVDARMRSLSARGIVRPGYIDELQKSRRTGHAVYYGALTWSLLMLEEWLLAHPA